MMAKIISMCWLLSAVMFVLNNGDEICYSSDLKAMKVRVRQFGTEIHDSVTQFKRDTEVQRTHNKEQEQAMETYQQEILVLKSNLSYLENAAAISERLVTEINNSVTDLKGEVEVLRSQNKEQEQTMESYQQEILILKSNVSKLENVTADSEYAVTELNNSVTQFKREVDFLRAQNTEQEQEMGKLQHEILLLKGNLSYLENTTERLVYLVSQIQNQIETNAQEGCTSPWFGFNESCYLFGNDTMDFFDAVDYCQRQAAHLVHVNSAEENEFIVKQLTLKDNGSYWLGITDLEEEGVWKWFGSNAPVTFTYWNTGQPDAFFGEEDCGHYYNLYNWHWNDNNCDSVFKPLCEA